MRFNGHHIIALFLLATPSSRAQVSSAEYFVSPDGNDTNPGSKTLPWKTIQMAASTVPPGSTVNVTSGTYNEKITIGVSGSQGAGFTTFRAFPGDTVILDGTGIGGDQLILIQDRSYVKIVGFDLRNNLGQMFGTGIWIRGGGSHIEIRNNVIHDMKAAAGGDAMAISVYGTDPSVSLSDIVIAGNLIYDCEPGHSETLTLNGNVEQFEVSGNVIHDVNNIGIDMIAGEGTCPTPSSDAARNGVCAGNTVYRARSDYGGGYAAGIYVDGGINITIERNLVYECDIGMEIGCENHGRIASGMVVRDNVLYNNDKGGLVFGGYNYPTTGRVLSSVFRNNTVCHNDVLNTGTGELWIQHAENCVVTCNIFSATSQNRLMTTTVGNSAGNDLDYNLWYAPGGAGLASVDWDGDVHAGYAAYVSSTGEDPNSVFTDPLFVSDTLPEPDIHLQTGAPAIDGADPGVHPDSGETDFFGGSRSLGSAMDIGAVEQILNLPGPPPAVELFSATAGVMEATLRWSRSDAGDFSAYRIYGGTNPAPASAVDSIFTIEDTVRVLTPLMENVRHYFRVTVIDAYDEESAFSNEKEAVPFAAGAPQAPTPLMAVTDTAGMVTISWSPVPDAGAYTSQVSTGPDMVAADVLDSVVTHTSVTFGPVPDSLIHHWRVNAVGGGGASPWSETKSYSTVRGNIPTVMCDRWNLVSLAGSVADARKTLLFPSAVSPAYRFQETYTATDTLEQGEGYWLKFDGAQGVSYTATGVFEDTVNVDSGWNLIGTVSAALPVSEIIPEGTLVLSRYYGYASGYYPADSLQPGKAFWVKVSVPGRLILSAGPP